MLAVLGSLERLLPLRVHLRKPLCGFSSCKVNCNGEVTAHEGSATRAFTHKHAKKGPKVLTGHMKCHAVPVQCTYRAMYQGISY